jgi:hypothetical protein
VGGVRDVAGGVSGAEGAVAAGTSLEDEDLRRGETAVSDRKPRKGDVVLVTFKAEYEGDGRDGSPPRVKVEKGGMPALISVADDSSFEVLEPADDPKDPWGTIRTEAPDGLLWVKCSNGDWTCLSVCVDDEDDDYVAGFPVTGAVPGTPAAEANPVPPQVLERVREMLSNGQRIRAIKAIREVCVGMGLKEAKAYAESLPEWAEGDRALGDQIRDGLNPHGWEPRVFQADGPEPPEDVTVLRWLDRDPAARWEYLVHTPSGWVWTSGPDQKPHAPATGAYWDTATRACPGRYREVQP